LYDPEICQQVIANFVISIEACQRSRSGHIIRYIYDTLKSENIYYTIGLHNFFVQNNFFLIKLGITRLNPVFLMKHPILDLKVYRKSVGKRKTQLKHVRIISTRRHI